MHAYASFASQQQALEFPLFLLLGGFAQKVLTTL